jgi:hypothetical protein
LAQVSGLKIQLQSGTDSTHFATWTFNSSTKITTPGGIRVGDYVTVKSGSKWYNGVTIASFVFSDRWQVTQITGNRVVLGRNPSGSHNIQSPIHINNLVGGSGGTSQTVDALDHYTVAWSYDTGNGVWFSGGSSDTKEKISTYSAPSNALRIRVTVTPVSKTREINGKETAYWTGTPVSAEYSTSVNPPEVPPTPTVEIDKYELIANVDNVDDPRTDEIQFEVYDVTKLINTGTATVAACLASFKCKVNAGGSYRVRARSANIVGTGRVYSDWTDFTASMSTIPSTPAGITTIRGSSSTSIYLEWSEVNSAETYDLEYTTKINYFDGSSGTTTVTGIEYNHYEQIGLESGQEYFFRVRAVNEKGSSSWSEIKSVVIGKKPAAPTTWSSATTVITGDPLKLYWVHNSEDGSSETYAEVEITINGETNTYTIKNEETDDDEKDKTKFYEIDTSEYQEGIQIKWRVRTAGITKVYGDWSVQRTVDIYAPPTLELSVTDQNGDLISVVMSFPFFIKGLAGPATQMPIGYHVTVTANEGYTTVDHIGRTKIVNPGEAVYSRYIDTNDPLLIEMSPGNIDLENNISYTITVVVSMNSGLTTIESKNFEVSWTDQQYVLDAEIAIDKDTFVAYVTPYCRDDDGAPIPDVTLAVYRREFDGTYTELSNNIDSTKNTVVTDPHPALDYARYRIVAISNSTGAVSFYDPPGYPVGGTAAIIQWEEEWSNFDVINTDETVQPLWVGSILRLPYNIDVSENNSSDVTLVDYIGRSYSVSYYGTKIASSATWNVDIEKTDQETIYALRRLAIWKGDVYVREPSGSGYWANINVSFSQKHKELIIPVTLNIKRVAGGV